MDKIQLVQKIWVGASKKEGWVIVKQTVPFFEGYEYTYEIPSEVLEEFIDILDSMFKANMAEIIDMMIEESNSDEDSQA